MRQSSWVATFSGALVALASAACPAACVDTVAKFQQALNNAVGVNSPSEVRVASGSYDLSATSLTFSSAAVGQGQLTISGGWNSGCTIQTLDAALSVLDGHNAGQAAALLQLQSSGGIAVSYLTIQGGSTLNTSYPAGLVAIRSGGSGDVDVRFNIIRANASPYFGGFMAKVGNDTAAAGDVHLDGNLIVGNTAGSGSGAAGVVEDTTSGRIYATNNTIADNVVALALGANMGGLQVNTSATLDNNILWGNTSADVNVSGLTSGSVIFTNNDYGTAYGTPDPTSSGNLDVDPKFVGSGDYHLVPESPLIGKGVSTPADGLPANDLEGNPRSYSGKVDLGAYESDVIFANGFDP